MSGLLLVQYQHHYLFAIAAPLCPSIPRLRDALPPCTGRRIVNSRQLQYLVHVSTIGRQVGSQTLLWMTFRGSICCVTVPTAYIPQFKKIAVESIECKLQQLTFVLVLFVDQ